MNEILEWWPLVQLYLSHALLLLGSLLIVIGAIGLLRLPDAMTQVHATGMIETLGAMSVLLGLMLKAGLTLVSIKLAIILLFLFFTGPAAGHALTRAVVHYRNRPWRPGRKPETPSVVDEVEPPVLTRRGA